MSFWETAEKISRRKFLRYLAYAGAAMGGGMGMVYATAVEPYQVEITSQRVLLPGLHESLNGLRAAQISDLHMGLFISREHLESAVALALAQQPDMLLITGDCLSAYGDTKRALADLEAVLGKVTGMVPVYAVRGNHDFGRQPHLLPALFEKLGVHLLVNDVLPFRRSAGVVYIAGMDSATAGRPNIARLVAAAPTDGPVILMAHEPDVADQTAESGKFALQLSGHTHGGQINLPFLGPLVLPSKGRKYVAGLYRVKDMLLYTNRGIGMMHLPARVNCPPEITMFTFEARRAGDQQPER
jgi:predicted MPP superfamily phosphohydrolase